MNRESLIYAQIGPKGVKGAKSADGFPISLGGGESGKLYKHVVIVEGSGHVDFKIIAISTKAQQFTTVADLHDVLYISGSHDYNGDYSDPPIIGHYSDSTEEILVLYYINKEENPYTIIYSSMAFDKSLNSDTVTEWTA